MNAGLVVGTVKLYHILKNLFEFVALKGDGDGKSLGAPTSYLVKLSLANISHNNGTVGI